MIESISSSRIAVVGAWSELALEGMASLITTHFAFEGVVVVIYSAFGGARVWSWRSAE